MFSKRSLPLVLGMVLTLLLFGLGNPSTLSSGRAPADAVDSTDLAPVARTTSYPFSYGSVLREKDGSRVRYGVFKVGPGQFGVCLNTKLGAPNGDVVTRDRVPGMTVANSKRAMYIMNKYKPANHVQGRAMYRFVKTLLAERAYLDNRKHFDAQLNKLDGGKSIKLSNRWLAESKNHGLRSGVQVATTPVLPGGKANVTASAKAANGTPAVGREVTFTTSTNARIVGAAKARLNGRGTAGAVHQRLELGRVAVRARIGSPSSKKAHVTTPTSGRQALLVTGNFREYARGSTAYSKNLRAVTRYQCLTDCTGRGKASATVTVPGNTWPVRVAVVVDGKRVATKDVRAGTTGSATAVVKDGTRFAASYCYLDGIGGNCRTDWVITADKEVVCPEWAVANISMTKDCTKCEASVGMTAPADSPRTYKAYVSVNGTLVVNGETLVNGTEKRFALGNVPSGTRVQAWTTSMGVRMSLIDVTHN